MAFRSGTNHFSEVIYKHFMIKFKLTSQNENMIMCKKEGTESQAKYKIHKTNAHI